MQFLEYIQKISSYLIAYDHNSLEREIRFLHFSQKTRSPKKEALLLVKKIVDHHPSIEKFCSDPVKLYRCIAVSVIIFPCVHVLILIS